MLGLDRAASESGYFINIIGLKTLDRNAVEEAVRRLRQQAIAGVVLVCPESAMAEALRGLPDDIPTVAIWGYAGTPVPVIASAESIGAIQATCHLLDLSHRTDGHTRNQLACMVTRQTAGVAAALSAQGGPASIFRPLEATWSASRWRACCGWWRSP